jgi:hypothetical protein
MEIIENIEENIIDLPCTNAKIGYADVLKLSFGKKLFYENSKLRNAFYGQIEISIETFSWRILKDELIVCGSSDDYKNAENGLKKIIGKKIVALKTENNSIQITLDTNYKIEAYKSTVEDDDLIFIDIEKGLSKSNYVFNGKEWKNYINPGLSKEELELNAFSELTNSRWKTKTPKTTSKNQCKNCDYYIELSGRFYFWDYGVCANKKSDYDGNVVNVNSSCENYSIERRSE